MSDGLRSIGSIPNSVPKLEDRSEVAFQNKDQSQLRSTFDDAVASTFYRQMFKALRASTSKKGMLTDSQTERIFQQQLDEVLIERMSKATGGSFSDDLFKQQFPDHQPSQSQATSPKPGSSFQADV